MTVYSGGDRREHQNSGHWPLWEESTSDRWFFHKGQVARKCFHVDYVILLRGKLHTIIAGTILRMRPANERRRYTVTSSLIGWRIHKMIPGKTPPGRSLVSGRSWSGLVKVGLRRRACDDRSSVILSGTIWVPFYSDGLTLIPACISTCNYTQHNYWGEITYPFQNCNGTTVEVSEWISNVISHLTGHIINHPCMLGL